MPYNTPNLATGVILWAKYGNNPAMCRYIFTIKVDTMGFDYSCGEAYIKKSGKTGRNTGSRLVGHSWVRITDGSTSI